MRLFDILLSGIANFQDICLLQHYLQLLTFVYFLLPIHNFILSRTCFIPFIRRFFGHHPRLILVNHNPTVFPFGLLNYISKQLDYLCLCKICFLLYSYLRPDPLVSPLMSATRFVVIHWFTDNSQYFILKRHNYCLHIRLVTVHTLPPYARTGLTFAV